MAENADDVEIRARSATREDDQKRAKLEQVNMQKMDVQTLDFDGSLRACLDF
jgi:hypothetical protein